MQQDAEIQYNELLPPLYGFGDTRHFEVSEVLKLSFHPILVLSEL
jgi:hypothetical protein